MDHVNHKQKCVPDEDFSAKHDENKSEPTKEQSEGSKPKMPTFQCSKCSEKFTNMVWYSKHQNSCSYNIPSENEYSEYTRPEPPKPDYVKVTTKNINKAKAQDQASETKPAPQSKATEQKSKGLDEKVQESSNKVPDAPATPGNVTEQKSNGSDEKVQETAKKVPENASEPPAKVREPQKKVSGPIATEEKPLKERRFSAIIPDEPPEKFIDSPPNDIKHGNCDQKKQVEAKHSKPEEHINGVNKHENKTNEQNASKKLNEATIGSKETQFQNDNDSDESKRKKSGELGPKTGKITKPAKQETVKMRNGLNKAAEEVIAPKKTAKIEAMEVDNEVAATPAGKKSDMPMGSLLKDLPANAPQASSPGRSPSPFLEQTMTMLISVVLATVILLIFRQSIQSLVKRDIDYL